MVGLNQLLRLNNLNPRILILIIFFIFNLGFVGEVFGADYSVCGFGCDYTSIQAAVNGASTGDTINVQAGTYNENVDVTKSLNIIGAGSLVTIVISDGSFFSRSFYLKADNINISGFTLKGSGSFGAGIYLKDVRHCNVSNINASENDFGINLKNSSNNFLFNNTASHNKYHGTYLDSSSDNNDVRNSSTHQNGYGIRISSSNENSIIGNNASKNTQGIYLSDSNGTRITDNYASLNGFYGVYLSSSNEGVISSNMVNSNTFNGISLDRSNSNNISQNDISLTGVSGISFDTSSNNFIFNNFFNNTWNLDTNSSLNSWSTTQTSGTNIMGGPYLGGNFWAYPNGTGFSQTCTDADGDGICDSIFNITSGNVDYLPLSMNFAPGGGGGGGGGGTYKNITVCSSGCNFTTIQAAINAANNGDTINVGAGSYKENVLVNKSVNLIGAGIDVSTIKASFNGDVISINANNTNVSGFSVIDAIWLGSGILLAGSNYCTINNIKSFDNWQGITLENSNNNIINSLIANDGKYGINLIDSRDNKLVNITAQENENYDFMVNALSDEGCNNIVEDINGTGGLPIKYFNTSVNLNNQKLSGLVLCNADFSVIENISIQGPSHNMKNNRVAVIRTDFSNFTNLSSFYSEEGIFLNNSNHNQISKSFLWANDEYGLRIENSNNNRIFNNTLKQIFGFGATFLNSANNHFSNNSFEKCYDGIVIDDSSENTITYNSFYSTSGSDFIVFASSDNYCDNIVREITGSGGRPIKYFNHSVTLKDDIYSELILCNADYSSLENITIEGSIQYKNNRIDVVRTDHSNFTTITSSHNERGILLRDSHNNRLINGNFSSNDEDGVSVGESNNNTIQNNTISDNGFVDNGILLSESNNNIISDNLVLDNHDVGISLYDSNFNTINNNNVSNTGIDQDHGIELKYSSGNRVISNTITENRDYDFWISAGLPEECSNIVKNNNISGNRPFEYYNSSAIIKDRVFSELVLCNADNSSLENVSIMGSDTRNNNGLRVVLTDNSNFSKVNSSFNREGISLSGSNNNSIREGIFGFNEQRGIFVDNSSLNLVSSNNFDNNKWYGCLLEDYSANNYFAHNSFSNNLYGLDVFSALNNTLFDNTISNNGWYGLYLSDVKDNLIYNNLLNNSVNHYKTGSFLNSWNTTKTSGTNIMGGPYLGGNFWAYPNGTGFSQICNNTDNDGLCDYQYNLTENETDYLPLTTYTPPAPSAPSGGGGGGGGGGGDEATSFIPNIKEDEPMEANFSETKSPYVPRIIITVKNEVYAVGLSLKYPSSKPYGAPDIEGEVYKYINIKKSETFKNEDIQEAVIKLKVEKKWLDDLNLSSGSVKLVRYINGQWVELEITFTGEDGEFAYFDAIATGLDDFAIIGDSDGVYEMDEEEEKISIPFFPSFGTTTGVNATGEIGSPEEEVVDESIEEVSEVTADTEPERALVPAPTLVGLLILILGGAGIYYWRFGIGK